MLDFINPLVINDIATQERGTRCHVLLHRRARAEWA
jgi:hypothetical protein